MHIHVSGPPCPFRALTDNPFLNSNRATGSNEHISHFAAESTTNSAMGITLSQRDALLSLRHEGPACHTELARRLNLEQSSSWFGGRPSQKIAGRKCP